MSHSVGMAYEQITLRLPPDLYEQLQKASNATGVSVNKIVIDILSEEFAPATKKAVRR